MLALISLQVRNASMIGCVAWALATKRICCLQTDASLPRDSSASVQSPPTRPVFLRHPAHICTLEFSQTLAQLWAPTAGAGTKYRQRAGTIGSCQMRPHYQALTLRLLCSSIMTSRRTCLAARPPLHTGTRVRLNITVLPLCLSLALCCTSLHNNPPNPFHTHMNPANTQPSISKPFMWSKLRRVTRPPSHYPRLVSYPFIEMEWHYSEQE